MSAILRFPYELCLQIASDKRLSRDDLAAMRLVCRLFASPAAEILFRRVKISRLKVDKDSLEHIAASEHLAQYVRELVWHELDLEAWVTLEEEALSLGIDHLPDGEFTSARKMMGDAASSTSLFWFPRLPFNDHQNFVLSSVSSFVAILDKFPHLTSFVSCPMPRDRYSTYNGSQIHFIVYRMHTQEISNTSNCGFFSYSE